MPARDDPAGKAINEVRPVRDEIERLVRGLLTALGDWCAMHSGPIL